MKRKTTRKRITSVIAIFLAALMAASVLFGAISTMVSANNSSTIKKKLNNLEAEASQLEKRKSALEADIAAKKSKSQSTIEKKGQIDQQIEITRLEIQNTNDQIQEYNLLIADKQAELDKGPKEQNELNQKHKARIRAMEENGAISFWSIIFHSSSFSDLLDNINMINEISTADQLMLGKMQRNNVQIAETRAGLEQDRTSLQDKIVELDALNETLVTQKADAEALIVKLSQELSELSGSYEELDAQESAIRQQIMQAQKDYESAKTYPKIHPGAAGCPKPVPPVRQQPGWSGAPAVCSA